MINEEMLFVKREAPVFEPLPERAFTVEFLDVKVEVKPKYKKPDELVNTLRCTFAILKGTDSKGDSLRGRFISRNYIPTYFAIIKTGKNVLYQIVEALLGRSLTQEEEANGLTSKFINELIGKQCGVVIKHKSKDNQVFSNIETFFVADEKAEALSDEERKHLLEIINRNRDEATTSGQPTEYGATHDEDADDIEVEKIPF